MARYRVAFTFAPETFVAHTLEPIGAFDEAPASFPTLFDENAIHLRQRAWIDLRDGAVHARYEFDDAYASAHPEALDREHLALLHGTLAAKILDDGAVVLDRAGLGATLRWRSLGQKGTRLRRDGSRRRGI